MKGAAKTSDSEMEEEDEERGDDFIALVVVR